MQKLRRFRNIALLIVAVLSISLMGVGYSIYVISGGNNNDIIDIPVDKVEITKIENIITNVNVIEPLKYDNTHGIITNDKLKLEILYNLKLIADQGEIPGYGGKTYLETGVLISIKIDDLNLYRLISNRVMIYKNFIRVGFDSNLYQLKQDCIFRYGGSGNINFDCFGFDDVNQTIEIHIPSTIECQYTSKSNCFINGNDTLDGFYLMVFNNPKFIVQLDFGILGEDGEFNKEIVYNNLNNKVHIDLAMEIY